MKNEQVTEPPTQVHQIEPLTLEERLRVQEEVEIPREQARILAVEYVSTLPRLKQFTSDDVCDYISQRGKIKEKRFLGPLLLHLRETGVITRGVGWVASRRRKDSPIAVWRKA